MNSTLCPELQDPINGQMESDSVTAVYSCDDGYTLTGMNMRECELEEGQWLGETPFCSEGII